MMWKTLKLSKEFWLSFFFNIYFLFFTIAEDYTLGLRGEQGVAGVNQLFLREKSIVVLDDVSHSPISPIAAS